MRADGKVLLALKMLRQLVFAAMQFRFGLHSLRR